MAVINPGSSLILKTLLEYKVNLDNIFRAKVSKAIATYNLILVFIDFYGCCNNEGSWLSKMTML